MKKLTIMLTALFMIITIASLGSASTLNVATEAGFMPFEYVSESGELMGFDMDLIKAVGDKLGMEVKIDNISWDGLIPALLNNSYDALIAGITITPEREATVAFSDPYFESVLTVITKNSDDSTVDLDSLDGKIAAVQINTTGDFATDDIPGLKDVMRFNMVPEAVQALIMGIADVVIIDLPVAEAYMDSNPDAPIKHVGPVASNEYYGIAINKKNQELLTQINSALTALKSDGTYDALYQKWFGVEE